jgi:FKBP-type peptidyl-prolyl cis-trans isomerase FkpA
MRKLMWMGVLALMACQGNKAGGGAAHSGPLETDDQKTLYALGLTLGRNIEVFGLTQEELAVVQRGLRDQVTGAKPEVKIEEWGPKLSQLARTRMEEKGKAQTAKGQEFINQAAQQPGAKKLESGVVYIPQQEGTGASPSATDRVKVHYKGTLVDGTQFDSSHERGEPATFPLNGVIPCWTQGLQQMKVGGKARLVCPADTAYGPGGRPGIPPNATLNFEVELLEVLQNNAPPPGMPPQAQ